MTIIEELSNLKNQAKKSTIEIWLEKLSQQERDALMEALLNPLNKTAPIWRICRRNGATFDQTDFGAYRNELLRKAGGE